MQHIKQALLNRLNATPLSRFRILGSLFLALILIISNFYMIFEDSLNLPYAELILGIMYMLTIITFIGLFYVDKKNRIKWIEQTAIHDIEIDEESSRDYVNKSISSLKTFMGQLTAVLFPFILIVVLIMFLMGDSKSFLVFGFSIVIMVIAYLYLKYRKKSYEIHNRVIVSEFGIIYKNDINLWVDHWYPCYIDSFDIINKNMNDVQVTIVLALTPTYLKKTKTFKFILPNKNISEISTFIDKIITINQANKERYKKKT